MIIEPIYQKIQRKKKNTLLIDVKAALIAQYVP